LATSGSAPTTTASAGSSPSTASGCRWATKLLHVDRGQFWFDAKVALPNKPVVEVRYTNELRKGLKDTTIWGGTDITGIPNVVPNPDPNGTNKLLTYTLTRKLVPGVTQIGERHQTLEASVTQKFGNTTPSSR
jgi:hypothetical protein